MKTLADLLLLGDPRLYETCAPVLESDLPLVADWVADLHQVMNEIRAVYHFGRGIAAPQLGIMKRLVYVNIDRPLVLLNPELVALSEATFELWDDCMSFPNLLVRVRRHAAVTVRYRDEHWQEQTWTIEEPALAELLQHECDHLDGILCTMRAIDAQSFQWRPTPGSATFGEPAS
ncbi:peptide deformylase [Hymenobacter cavernae]|uniref:Peptide deformylase n=1 Tax=Hymenobacter cavernae TaxID=2044852 RepID=A0ABQ1UCB3_9BACT|nr:peptide deformylase [Hymenobacter cavernae]GGF13170.1 peptide deformylase [Hymenobacter cavernae]